MDSKTYFSLKESRILGLRIGRAEPGTPGEIAGIREAMDREQLDMFRIRISAFHKDLFIEMDKLGLPYYILNILHIYERLAGHMPLTQNVSFREVMTEEDRTLLKNIIRLSFDGEAGTYFSNPALVSTLDADKELASMIEYVLDSIGEPDRFVRIVDLEGQAVGFLYYQVHGGVARGELFGIVPEYRRRHLSVEIGKLVLNQFAGMKVNNSIKIQNLASIRTHIALGFYPTDAIINIHILNKK
jgi:hypothetical protein